MRSPCGNSCELILCLLMFHFLLFIYFINIVRDHVNISYAYAQKYLNIFIYDTMFCFMLLIPLHSNPLGYGSMEERKEKNTSRRFRPINIVNAINSPSTAEIKYSTFLHTHFFLLNFMRYLRPGLRLAHWSECARREKKTCFGQPCN